MTFTLHRRCMLGLMAAAMLTPQAIPAWSQDAYPTKPVAFLVGNPPGGPSDFVARLVGDALTASMGQGFVVENRSGGGGAIAMTAIANAEPDGYTIALGQAGPMTVAPNLQNLPYKADSFTPIAKIADTPMAFLVSPELGVNTIDELVALIRANPGKFNYGSDGIGTSTHLAFELFRSRVGDLDVEHIPFKGSAEILQNYASGSIQMSITGVQAALGQVKEGSIKALAVSSAERLPALPDVPTMTEAGFKDLEISSWTMLIGPSGLPDPIRDRLADEFHKVMAKPELVEKMTKLGALIPDYRGPAESKALIERFDSQWKKVIADAGIKAQN